MARRILIVDDEQEFCISTARILRSCGYAPLYATTSAGVIDLIRNKEVEFVLLDFRMPGVHGIDLLQLIRKEFKELPVIVVSGHATIDITVQAMKFGALNLYTKPIDVKILIKELDAYFSGTARRPDESGVPLETEIVARSPSMAKVLEMCDTVARTNAAVLITGESGTGKELVANRIHLLSDRRNQPFYKINCAALPEALLESELFGHDKGSFTGAISEKKGFFELPSRGTILLDEIAELTPSTQAKLLRVLQEGEFIRVGGCRVMRTNARILSATNVDMKAAIARGQFREDIFYRLSVVGIHVPPLRERREDILPLVDLFVQQFSRKYQKKVSGIEKGFRESLRDHTWPGNVRELRNIMERSIIFCKTEVLSFDEIPGHYRENLHESGRLDLNEYFRNLSREKAREILLEALQKSQGSKSKAARLLSITRKTLYNRLRKYDIG
jgi:two-component system, NtrC family, response regulator AtoC